MIMLGINAAETSTTPIAGVGDRGCDTIGSEFIYGRASEALTAKAVVIIDETKVGSSTAGVQMADTTSSASAFGSRVGVAQVAFADDDYGWFQVLGKTEILCGATCAANVAINTTATAGTLDDDATSGAEVIDGIVLDTAETGSAGYASAILNLPTVGATLV